MDDKLPGAVKQVLIDEHGWVELGRIQGILGEESVEGIGLTLKRDQVFFERFDSSFRTEGRTSIDGLSILVTGPDIIYSTHMFMQGLFRDLNINLTVGDHTQSILLMKDGKVNCNDVVLMGEIRDWMMYMFKRWEGVEIGEGDVPVVMEVEGRTLASGEGSFALELLGRSSK